MVESRGRRLDAARLKQDPGDDSRIDRDGLPGVRLTNQSFLLFYVKFKSE